MIEQYRLRGELREESSGGANILEDVFFQCSVIVVAVIPLLVSPIFIGLGTLLLLKLETLSVGVSHEGFLANSSSIESLCFGQQYGLLFRGVDILLCTFIGHAFQAMFFATIAIRFSRGAWERLGWAFAMVIVLIMVPLGLLKESQVITPEFVIFLAALEVTIPDAVRSFRLKSARKICKRLIIVIQTTIILTLSGCLVIAFVYIAVGRDHSAVIEFFLLGLVYPCFAIYCRFMIRGFTGRAITRKNSSDSQREESLAVKCVTNETAVTLFTVPGFFAIYMIEKNTGFLSATSMQLVMEPIGALLFVKVKGITRDIEMFASSKAVARVQPSSHLSPDESKVEGEEKPLDEAESKDEWERKKWSGLVLSEMVGEKRSILVASLLGFALKKDLAEFFMRIGFSLIAEMVADMVKISIYTSSGIIEDLQLQLTPLNVLSASFAVTFVSFFCFSSVLIVCWYR